MFALITCENIQGEIPAYTLCLDGSTSQIDVFQDQLEEAYRSQFIKLLYRLEKVSNTLPLPTAQKRKINGTQCGFEIKTKNLRLYYIFYEEQSVIICMVGFKTRQKKDIKKFKELEKQLLSEIEDKDITEFIKR